MSESLTKHRIGDLVERNQAWARGLHGLGVSLFEHSGHTLRQVCERLGLAPYRVIALLEQAASPATGVATRPQVQALPIHLVVEYLRHTHHLFIRERLPYLAYLVEGLSLRQGPHKALAGDMQLVFPLFREDFIHHIHEEEDTLFAHIARLSQAARGIRSPGRVWQMLRQISLSELAAGHEIHDDEMAGMRSLTSGYRQEPGMELALRVLYHELEAFEQDLITHAAVENHILFPKALRLENYVRQSLEALAGRS